MELLYATTYSYFIDENTLKIHFKNNSNKELIYFGVIHNFGFTDRTKALLNEAKVFNPDILVLHTFGTPESIAHYLKNHSKKTWEETYFLAEYGLDRKIKLDLGSSDFYDDLTDKLLQFNEIQNVIEVNLLRELCLEYWKNRNSNYKSDDCLKNTYLIKKLNLPFSKLLPKVEEYIKTYYGKNLDTFIEEEVLSSKNQPLILAPYPINKDDIGKLNKYRSDEINNYEMSRVLIATETNKRVFAETGKTHFLNQIDKIINMLGNTWSIKYRNY